MDTLFPTLSGRYKSYFNTTHYVLVATGRGMEWIFPIIKRKLSDEPHSHLTIVYSNHTEADIWYKQELEGLQKRFNQQLQVTFFVENTTNPHFTQGEITQTYLEALINQNIKPHLIFGICADEAVSDFVRDRLLFLGIPSRDIHQTNIPQ